jgi:hypothetical protein
MVDVISQRSGQVFPSEHGLHRPGYEQVRDKGKVGRIQLEGPTDEKSPNVNILCPLIFVEDQTGYQKTAKDEKEIDAHDPVITPPLRQWPSPIGRKRRFEVRTTYQKDRDTSQYVKRNVSLR